MKDNLDSRQKADDETETVSVRCLPFVLFSAAEVAHFLVKFL